MWGLYTHLSFGLRQSQGSSFLRGRTATGKKVHSLGGGIDAVLVKEAVGICSSLLQVGDILASTGRVAGRKFKAASFTLLIFYS